MLRALAQQAGGGITGALASLEHALRLAEPEGYVRVFVDEGRPMAALLRSQLKSVRRAAELGLPSRASQR